MLRALRELQNTLPHRAREVHAYAAECLHMHALAATQAQSHPCCWAGSRRRRTPPTWVPWCRFCAVNFLFRGGHPLAVQIEDILEVACENNVLLALVADHAKPFAAIVLGSAKYRKTVKNRAEKFKVLQRHFPNVIVSDMYVNRWGVACMDICTQRTLGEAVNFQALAQLYAAAGFAKEAARILQKMEENPPLASFFGRWDKEDQDLWLVGALLGYPAVTTLSLYHHNAANEEEEEEEDEDDDEDNEEDDEDDDEGDDEGDDDEDDKDEDEDEDEDDDDDNEEDEDDEDDDEEND